MAEIIWGWKAIREEVGHLMGYEPSIDTMRRWTEPGVIGDPLPAMTTKTGRVYAKKQELAAWCRKLLH